jgi:hypothetical protein
MPTEETTYDDDFAGEAQGGGPSTRPSSARLTFPGLPGVAVPEVALKPLKKALTASGVDRNPHTVIVAHNKQRDDSMQPKHMEPTNAQKMLRSVAVSPLYPEPVAKWDPGYLNEVAYATSSKERQALDRERERKKLRAEEAAKYKKPPRNKKTDEGAAAESFFDRQMAMDRRLMEGRAEAKDKYLASLCAPPTKHKWCEVQDSFLSRWKQFNKKREENLAKLDASTKPSFRCTLKGFHKPSDEPLVWNEEIAAAFFESQEKCIERLKARETAAEEAAKKASVRGKRRAPFLPKKAQESTPHTPFPPHLQDKVNVAAFKSTYQFKTPLPDFYTRQNTFAEGRNATFEERLAKMRA